MESQLFYAMLDSAGMLALPGWCVRALDAACCLPTPPTHACYCRCCCDAWQHWTWWQEEQYSIASASLRDQFLLLSSHPSVLAFMLSSDELPPPDVEAMCCTRILLEAVVCFVVHVVLERYNNVTQDVRWLDHAQTLSAAAAVNSSLSGLSGVKMSGPYSWVSAPLFSITRRQRHRPSSNSAPPPDACGRCRPPTSPWMTADIIWAGDGVFSRKEGPARAPCQLSC